MQEMYFTDNLPESALPNRLEEIKEAIRREIRKELKVNLIINCDYENLVFIRFVWIFMEFTCRFFLCTLKIKEGAEKLREVTTDRRSLSDVASIVKKSNSKLAELKSELDELESQILLTKGNSNRQGKYFITVLFNS